MLYNEPRPGDGKRHDYHNLGGKWGSLSRNVIVIDRVEISVWRILDGFAMVELGWWLKDEVEMEERRREGGREERG